MSIVKRISEFIENQGISYHLFEQKISASNGLIRKAIVKNTDIQSKWITTIIDNFPNLNPVWLLTGKGEMITNGNNDGLQDDKQNQIIGRLMDMVANKDQAIKELNDKLGELREQNAILKTEKSSVETRLAELKNEYSNLEAEITLINKFSSCLPNAECAKDVNANLKKTEIPG